MHLHQGPSRIQRAVQAPKNGLVLSTMRSSLSNNIGRNIIQSRGIVAESAAAAMVAAAKIQGAGIATVGLAGAGVGIGTVFGSLRKNERLVSSFHCVLDHTTNYPMQSLFIRQLVQI